MEGLNKPRSRLGVWIDRKGIKQDWVIKQSGVNKLTISRACNDEGFLPSGKTMQKIVKALRQIDPDVNASEFWDV